MPITLTCPSCGKQCTVKEEYAGMQVRCPGCPGVISVPAVTSAAVAVEAEPLVAVAPSSPVPAAPGNDAVASFVSKATGFLAANGVTGVSQTLLLVGLGCLAFFLITVLLPWTPSIASLVGPGFDLGGKFEVSLGSR